MFSAAALHQLQREAIAEAQRRVEAQALDRRLTFYGGAQQFHEYDGHEVILSGPFETGKTIAALDKLHHLLKTYRNARGLMLRKVYNDLIHSAVVTYEKKVLPVPPEDARSRVNKYGGEKPQFYDYPNGARLICAGLDKPGKVLSAEYDFIYVNQAEELTLEDWEILTARASGRAGNAPLTQVMGDCNPSVPTHWILNRKTLKVIEQRHEHNPTLFNPLTGEITERGKRTMAILDALTGTRYKRGRLGLWVGEEGQVYDTFDPAIHVIDRFNIPADWTRYRAIDFGYTNPFVCQWWAQDHDGRLYLYREIYMTQRTVRVHGDDINRLEAGERISATYADHDAEDRATLSENRIATVGAKKDISPGIQAVQDRLKVQPDGKPRIFFLRDSLVEADRNLYREYPGDTQPVCTEQEFGSYVWATGVSGKSNKEVPVDAYNHGMDAMRYLVYSLKRGGKGKSSASPY